MKTDSAQTILIASDHAGYELKEFLIKELTNLNLSIIDLGCDSAEKSVDYPDYAKKLGEKLTNEIGILICGSGVGISIAANRFSHIRAALCCSAEVTALSRLHNNANVLCLGARIISKETALDITKTFLNTKFEGGRHEKRVAKLSQ